MLRYNGPRSDQSPSLCVLPSERVYAVGDVHGRCDLLHAMLETIRTDIAQFSDGRTPRVIFMGDYVDRGDHSREVLETLSDHSKLRDKLGNETGMVVEFLAGNHEVAMLKFLKDPVAGRAWLGWGGIQTLASYGIQSHVRTPDSAQLKTLRDHLLSNLQPHLPFLENLSKLVVSGKVVFVHAGLDPSCSLEDQPEEAVFWGQNPSGQKPGRDGYRMVHGHYASDKPVTLPDRICVDTGAYYSGRLTSVRLDSTESFLQVDAAILTGL